MLNYLSVGDSASWFKTRDSVFRDVPLPGASVSLPPPSAVTCHIDRGRSSGGVSADNQSDWVEGAGREEGKLESEKRAVLDRSKLEKRPQP